MEMRPGDEIERVGRREAETGGNGDFWRSKPGEGGCETTRKRSGGRRGRRVVAAASPGLEREGDEGSEDASEREAGEQRRRIVGDDGVVERVVSWRWRWQ